MAAEPMRSLGRKRIFVYDGPYEGLHPAWGVLASLALAAPGALALAALALLPYAPPEFERLVSREIPVGPFGLRLGGVLLLLPGLAGAGFCLREWRRGSAPGSDRQGRMLVRAVVETVVMLLFIVPANLAPIFGGRDLLGVGLVALVFDGFLIWALARSYAKLRGYLRFGEARLELAGAPRLGGPVEGRLYIERAEGLWSLKARLRRVEIGWVSRRDSGGDSHSEPVFLETHEAEREFGPAEAPGAAGGLRFSFALPDRVDPPKEDFRAQWELLIEGSGDEAAYRSAFRIPVDEAVQ